MTAGEMLVHININTVDVMGIVILRDYVNFGIFLFSVYVKSALVCVYYILPPNPTQLQKKKVFVVPSKRKKKKKCGSFNLHPKIPFASCLGLTATIITFIFYFFLMFVSSCVMSTYEANQKQTINVSGSC